jgi:hypothetical protein
MREHLPEPGPRMHRSESRSVVDHAIFGEELNHIVIEPVVDAVGIAVNEIDDLVLVEKPLKGGGRTTFHQSLGFNAFA